MSILLADYQDVQTLSVTGLSTLANGSAVQSAAQTSTDWSDTMVRVELTSSTGAAANGIVSVAVRGSIDGADFDDEQNERVVATLVFATPGQQTRSATFLVAGAEPLPPFWMLSFRNATGASLSAATVKYRGISRQPESAAVEPVAVPVDTFTTQAGDGTTSLDTGANAMTIAYGTTATSLRGSYGGLTVGQRYRVSWTLSGTSGGQAGFGTSLGGPQYRPTIGGNLGVNTFDFTSTTTTLYLTFQRASAGTTTFSALSIVPIPEVTWLDISPQPLTAATWTVLDPGVTVDGSGVITIAATGTTILARGALSLTVGKPYRLVFTVGNVNVFALIGTSAGGSQNKSASSSHSPGAVVYEFVATAATTYFQFHRSASGTAVVSGIKLQQIDEPLVATDFGLVPNAGTDQQTALQTFFNAGTAQSKRLYLPSGQYNHSAPLTLTSASLYGDGIGKTILHGTNNVNCALNITGTNPSVQRMTIQSTGKSFADPRPSDRLGNGIYVVSANGYLIKNCHILNVGEAGIMSEYSNNGKVLNNLVELTTADGIYHTEGATNIEVAYNKTITTGDDAISFTSYSTPQLVHDITIHHNSVIGNFESRGITVNGGSNIQIYNNHVDGGTAGISVGATTAWGSTQNTNITVTNNTVRDCTFTGTGTIGGGALHLYNDQTGTDTGIVFTNNDVYNPANYGIYVWGTTQISASITNNNFYQSAARTVYVNGNAGATQITQNNNPRFEPNTYPGDKVSSGVGGPEAFAPPEDADSSAFSSGFSSGFS